MDKIANDVFAVLMAIVALAAFGELVSRNTNATGVINSGSSAFNTALATAEGPVTGYSPGPPIYTSSSQTGFGAFPEPSLELS